MSNLDCMVYVFQMSSGRSMRILAVILMLVFGLLQEEEKEDGCCHLTKTVDILTYSPRCCNCQHIMNPSDDSTTWFLWNLQQRNLSTK